MKPGQGAGPRTATRFANRKQKGTRKAVPGPGGGAAARASKQAGGAARDRSGSPSRSRSRSSSDDGDSAGDDGGGGGSRSGDDGSGSGSDVEDAEDYCKGGYHPVQVGEKFKAGRYVVLRKLGWGHFSTVWLVLDTATHTFAALKVQKSAQHYTDAARDEVTLLGQLRAGDPTGSARCVRLLDHFEHAGPHGLHVCLVFEVLGDNLLALIRAYDYRGLPLPVVRNLARQVLTAVDYMHAKCGILHTDIKPENVMLADTLAPRRWELALPGAGGGGGGGAGAGAGAAAAAAAGGGGGGAAAAAAAAGGGALTKNQKKKAKRRQAKAAASASMSTGQAAAGDEGDVDDDANGGGGGGDGEAQGPADDAACADQPGQQQQDQQQQQEEDLKQQQDSVKQQQQQQQEEEEPKQQQQEQDQQQNDQQQQQQQHSNGGGAEADAAAPALPARTLVYESRVVRTPEELASATAKVVDFGNACWLDRRFTDDVQTRQYRCPEVILGAKWGAPADVWSVACLVFELATGDYLFEPRGGPSWGRDEDHLALVVELLGRLPRRVWATGRRARDFFNRHGELRRIRRLKPWGLRDVLAEKYRFSARDAAALADFLLPMLRPVPEERATAAEMLRHPWLAGDGAAADDGAQRQQQQQQQQQQRAEGGGGEARAANGSGGGGSSARDHSRDLGGGGGDQERCSPHRRRSASEAAAKRSRSPSPRAGTPKRGATSAAHAGSPAPALAP